MSSKVDLFEYQSLTSNISRIVMFDWEQPDDEDNWWPGLKNWVNTQNSKALNNRIHDQWERLLDTIDDKILDVHRSMYAHVFTQPEVLSNNKLYKHENLVKDIQDYQACAVALQNLNFLGKRFLKRTQVNNLPNPISMGNIDVTNSSTEIVESYWPQANDDFKFNLLEDNWRRFFSYNGEMYDELDKIIENLPGNLPHGLVSKLSNTKLKRSLTNRLEFLTYMLAVDKFNSKHHDKKTLNSFLFADEDNIKKAIDLYNQNKMGKHIGFGQDHSDLGYGKTADIGRFINFVIKNYVIAEGNILEITNNAIDQVVLEKM